jgi:hypothetical protein
MLEYKYALHRLIYENGCSNGFCYNESDAGSPIK